MCERGRTLLTKVYVPVLRLWVSLFAFAPVPICK